ncbi:DUF3455 domain-containing protein [Trinickia acidisoli]|uniref:DUF3455 domain-containing protein n=1 Tax=Trinickia acidisoli TaxID=2767482 RepID=UPI001A8CD6A7|nr:DUF3455 domain-containing protein [Trinickia acidisoli]
MTRLSFFAVSASVALASSMIGLAGCASTAAHSIQPSANSALPTELRVGPKQSLDDVLVTLGDETWRCARAAVDPASSAVRSNSALQWVQVGSAGTLVTRKRRNVGTVLPGDYFVAYDGSFVKAIVTHQSQVDANTLTWARYSVQYDGNASPAQGRFAHLSSILRIETTGGLPPNPRCMHEGLQLLVPYSATYLLYRASVTK